MKTTADYIAAGFEKIDTDLAALMEALREVLGELGAEGAAAHLPWQSRGGAHDITNPPEGIEQAYSIAFQLLNMVEENAAARTRRLREIEHGLDAEPGLWGRQLARLKAAGWTGEDIADFLPLVRVEPVLTAHPTEAKRPSVLEQHRAIFRLLSSLEDSDVTPSERRATGNEIKVVLERLWRTGEILLEKPTVASERRSMIHYLCEVLPTALEHLDQRLRHAWDASGFDPALLADPRVWPRIRFGNWVGGDRDGHPFVTAEVTRDTLADLRRHALGVLARQLSDLAAKLPLSGGFQKTPPAFDSALTTLRTRHPQAADQLARQYPDEPWRQYVLLLKAGLPFDEPPPAARSASSTPLPRGPRASSAPGPASCRTNASPPNTQDSPPQKSPTYPSPSDLDADLAALHEALQEVGAHRLAETAVRPVRRTLDAFGFHLASLDIRQNSEFHDQALTQILAASGQPAPDFSDWEEPRRLQFLNEELRSPRPFLYQDTGIGTEADAVLSSYAILRRHIRHHGRAGIGSLIISMTRRTSDLLVVYLLAREGGLMQWGPEGLLCKIPVVPLFETLDDLERSPEVMETFLAHPVTRRSLAFHQHDRALPLSPPQPLPVQQIMVGYSDSNKDCGIIASQWALHQAQAALTAVGHEHGTKIRFFHGRGGTISRGAGPTHRFLGALPPHTIDGDLRLTEQGETIAQKYANLATATYNLEILLAGVTGFSLTNQSAPPPSELLEKTGNLLAAASREKYTSLIQAPGFMTFYSEATPIDALETSSIGSRPARRTGQRTLDDLRAIPWVFSWNQSRYYLPGWFGVGTGLESLLASGILPLDELGTFLKDSPLFYYVLTNVETNLASCDTDIMRQYASLVGDDEVRERLLAVILEEYEKTGTLLSKIFGGSVESRRPRMVRTLHLRADALKILHHQQIELLRTWRAARADNPSEAEKLLPKVLLSVNAIASGLRTTG